MTRFKTIQYAVDSETRQVVSRVNGILAWPILNWNEMTPANNFEITYTLEKINFFNCLQSLKYLTWTKKIPVAIKNYHRKFWGMKPLKEAQ